MKTDNGTKTYPFRGKYLVAAKTAVVSPTNMNILYLEVDNPLKISVPGYTAGVISAVINNGTVSAVKKTLGEYSARPSKKGKAIVSLFTNVNGRRTKMGDMEFRVKSIPPPKVIIQKATFKDGDFVISKSLLKTVGGVDAEMKDFDFKGIFYNVTSFRLGVQTAKGFLEKEQFNGSGWTDAMVQAINDAKSGSRMYVTNIKAKRKDSKAIKSLDNISIFIK